MKLSDIAFFAAGVILSNEKYRKLCIDSARKVSVIIDDAVRESNLAKIITTKPNERVVQSDPGYSRVDSSVPKHKADEHFKRYSEDTRCDFENENGEE